MLVGAVCVYLVQKSVNYVWLKLPSLADVYRDMFGGHNVLVLGDAQSGKTALLWLMRTHKPYMLKDGKRISPDRTRGRDDKPYALMGAGRVDGGTQQRRKRAQFSVNQDLAGEATKLWLTAISETDPTGILYLLRADDALQKNENFQVALHKLRTYVLEPCARERGRLRSLCILITFKDLLSRSEMRQARDNVELAVNRELARANCRALRSLQLYYEEVQLAAHASEWNDAETALRHFGLSLREHKKRAG